MPKVVGVRFKKAGKIYYFDPMAIEVEKGSEVVVETARGMEFGTAVNPIKEVEEDSVVAPLKPIVRLATAQDRKTHVENKEMAKEAFSICEEKIQKQGLEMYLVDSEYTFDRNKLIFYFTAEGRIDFRELVKELASVFRVRIELRQIGIRDVAKSLNGLGCCGRSLCCANWLSEFQPVSIKMAKDQGLSLNPTKISGICGRLFCCLKYEHETYEGILRNMPDVGSIVQTPDGNGKVTETFLLKEEMNVSIDVKGSAEIRKYKLHEVKLLKKARKNSDAQLKEIEKELKMLED